MGQKGLSLVEVAIMLLVLMLLTSVLAPSVFDFVHDAQWVKVKEDCEAIGIALSRLYRDVGPCLRVNALSPCTLASRVDVLISSGATPELGPTAVNFVNANMATANWTTAAIGNYDSMENQFILNTPAYSTPYQNYFSSSGGHPVGPLFGLGWRGAYLSPPIGPDPWGSAYFVNAGFFATATDITGPSEGSSAWWWERDVICVTPGPDKRLDTPFGGTAGRGTNRSGDDFVSVVAGSGR
jgi:type II secretory pathway pseudopilin PulG